MGMRSICHLFAAILMLSFACAEELSIDAIMNSSEQEAIGINRLTPAEREAFEQWVATWTRRVIQQAPAYHPSMSLSQWVSEWPAYLQPKPVSKEEAAKQRQEANQVIFRNLAGATLELRDGSLWNVTFIDQPLARFWARDQRITITTNPRDLVRPFILFNEDRREQVGGTRARSPSPSGQRPNDPPAYFQGTNTIASITPDGITIRLTSGEVWIVAPTGQQVVQATWRARDRIRVERSADAIYRHRLVNVDSGDSVLANPPSRSISQGFAEPRS